MTSAAEESLGNVLVIGGCGYLGSAIVELLLADPKCSSVHVMSRNPTHNLRSGANYHAGDIASTEDVTCVLEKVKPSVIIHTASPRYTDSEKSLRHTNVTGTKVLLKSAFASSTVKAFVYASSDSACVPRPGKPMVEEDAVLYTEESNANPYEKTKGIADAMVLNANSPPDLFTAVLRLPSLYGKNNETTLGGLLASVGKGEHKMQVGKDEKPFEFLYIEKAAEAHILAAKALLATSQRNAKGGKVDGEAFWVSDGVPMPYFDFARKVAAFAGHPVAKGDIQVVPYWIVYAFAWITEWLVWGFSFGTRKPELPLRGVEYLGRGFEFDISKVKERLGYRPVEDMDATLKEMVEFEVKRLKM